MEDGGDFAHFDEEGGAAAGEIVAGPDAREDAIGEREAGAARGHERAHLGHQDDERGLAKIGGFAAHVGSGDQKELVAAGFEAESVGNEALALLLEEFFDDGMAAADDEEFAGVVELWADVVAVGSKAGEIGENVEFGDGGGGATKARGLGSDARAEIKKKVAFDFERCARRRREFYVRTLLIPER